MNRQKNNVAAHRIRNRAGCAALLTAAALLLCGCGNKDMTLSQKIEALENWKLPGLVDEENDRLMMRKADAVAGAVDADGAVAGSVAGEGDPDALAAAEEAVREEQTRIELAMQNLVGKWSELSDALPLFRPIISWFGDLELLDDGTYKSQTASGTWELSLDGTQVILRGSRGKTVADIVQDGGYTKLSVPELHLTFLRKGELKKYINERFVCVKITAQNVEDYIMRPVNVGVILDEKDKPTNESAWVLGSAAYEKGLVYYGRSENFTLTVQKYQTGSQDVILPYDTLALTTGANFGRITNARGTLVYVRAEYVADNRMTDARTRTITFTDGTTHTTSMTWYSDLANYNDWLM